MAQGRGSAMVALTVLFCILVLHSVMAYAATYNVGGAGGWTFGVVDWPKGKNFRAGDILVFNYIPGLHNVVAVDKAEYEACTPIGTRVYGSGNDHIKLVKGPNYFICSYIGHCWQDMKIAVNAA